MQLSEVVGHANKSCSETTPTFDKTFFFFQGPQLQILSNDSKSMQNCIQMALK